MATKREIVEGEQSGVSRRDTSGVVVVRMHISLRERSNAEPE